MKRISKIISWGLITAGLLFVYMAVRVSNSSCWNIYTEEWTTYIALAVPCFVGAGIIVELSRISNRE